jgi:phosphoribosylglycinamide formyltransferase-1
MSKTHIAIFASGNGTNAEEIIRHFGKSRTAKVALVLSNNPKAYVLERAARHSIPYYAFGRNDFYKTRKVDEVLRLNGIGFVVLAGFMWLIPERLVRSYRNRMVNIHPALLPKYGGKGMYGMHVHEAVIANKEKESGITIHWVNEKYDDGQVLFQARCKVEKGDTPEQVAQKVHALEYKHYPEVIEKAIRQSKAP